MDQLHVTATFPAIGRDNLDEFKDGISRLTANAGNEEGTLRYDPFFNEDESRCVVQETYRDSAAVLTHMGAAGELLGPLAELGGGLEIEVFGDPSEELREASAEMQPAIYSHFAAA